MNMTNSGFGWRLVNQPFIDTRRYACFMQYKLHTCTRLCLLCLPCDTDSDMISTMNADRPNIAMTNRSLLVSNSWKKTEWQIEYWNHSFWVDLLLDSSWNHNCKFQPYIRVHSSTKSRTRFIAVSHKYSAVSQPLSINTRNDQALFWERTGKQPQTLSNAVKRFTYVGLEI